MDPIRRTCVHRMRSIGRPSRSILTSTVVILVLVLDSRDAADRPARRRNRPSPTGRHLRPASAAAARPARPDPPRPRPSNAAALRATAASLLTGWSGSAASRFMAVSQQVDAVARARNPASIRATAAETRPSSPASPPRQTADGTAESPFRPACWDIPAAASAAVG